MRTNGHGETPRPAALGATQALSHIRWQTDEAIVLPIGALHASGDASAQVRNPQRLAEVGEVSAQINRVQRVIVQALTGALTAMEPSADDLATRRDEIASLTLVAANMKLSAVGVILLELRIVALAV